MRSPLSDLCEATATLRLLNRSRSLSRRCWSELGLKMIAVSEPMSEKDAAAATLVDILGAIDSSCL